MVCFDLIMVSDAKAQNLKIKFCEKAIAKMANSDMTTIDNNLS